MSNNLPINFISGQIAGYVNHCQGSGQPENNMQQTPYLYPQLYPHYSQYLGVFTMDNTAKALKIIKKLIEKEIVKDISVKDFITLLDDISKEL